jgi:hypothetical protein
MRWRSETAAELWWPGRASMSPTTGGGDGGGELTEGERNGSAKTTR